MLSDSLFNLNPNQQGMMGLGAAMMEQGGPSPTPVGFGQGLGTAFLQMQQRQMQMQQQMQMQKLRERQLSKLERELDLSDREQKVRDKLADRMENAGMMDDLGAGQSFGRMDGGGYTPVNVGPEMMSGGVRIGDQNMMQIGAQMQGLGRRGQPIIREFHEGGNLITKQYTNGQWVPMATAPRWEGQAGGPSGAKRRMDELIQQNVPPDTARAVAYGTAKETRDPISGYPIIVDIGSGRELGRMERDPANPTRRIWTTPGIPKPSGNKDVLLRQAREAIAAGANKNAVIQRLKQNGIDPVGL